MIFSLFRRSDNALIIDRLYALVVEASREPALYVDLAIPDTFEGRFESLTAHAWLIAHRLRQEPPAGPEIAQSLVDTIFRHFDRTLREMGVGDTSVPKRMKGLAEAFLGRSASYDQAYREGSPQLAACMSRNVYRGEKDGVALARYIGSAANELASAPLQAFLDATIRFPNPAAFAETSSAMREATL